MGLLNLKYYRQQPQVRELRYRSTPSVAVSIFIHIADFPETELAAVLIVQIGD